MRSWNIARYLAREGWDVTVVTPHPSVWKDPEPAEHLGEQLKRAGVTRLNTGQRWRCLEPSLVRTSGNPVSRAVGRVCRTVADRLEIERPIGWASSVHKACSALRRDDVDLVLASGPPFLAFTLARELGERLRRPYVLDYRDLWTGDPHTPRNRPATIRRERMALEGASAVTVISPSCAESLRESYGLGGRVSVVTNGFDPEEMAAVQPAKFDHFAIVYTGIFYPPKRVVRPVFQALALIKERRLARNAWRFHYYGDSGEHVMAEAERFGLTSEVELHGSVPRSQALSATRGAGLAVVITTVSENASRNEQGIMTGKVFEMVGLGTPFLLVAQPGADPEVVARNSGLGRRFSGLEIEGMASYLAAAIDGAETVRGDCAEYQWPTLVCRLDAILRRALSGEPAINGAKVA